MLQCRADRDSTGQLVSDLFKSRRDGHVFKIPNASIELASKPKPGGGAEVPLNFASISTDLEWTVVLVMNQLMRSLGHAVTTARLLTDIKEIAGLI